MRGQGALQRAGVFGATSPPGFFGGSSGMTVVDSPNASSVQTAFTLTADASANTKGLYTQLIASTSAHTTLIYLTAEATSASATNTSMLLDLATGAALSESVICSNLLVGYRAVSFTANGATPAAWFIPCNIPAGTRVAARIQSAVAGGDTCVTRIRTYGGGRGTSGITTMGVTEATSLGTTVTSGATSNEGLWTEIEDATASAFSAVFYAIQAAADTDIASSAGFLVDVGVGASTAETAIHSDIAQLALNTEALVNFQPYMSGLIPTAIPAGSRLSVRIQSAAAAAQDFDVALYGVA